MEGNLTPDKLEFLGLTIYQPARGYRYSIDAILLADFAAREMTGGRVLDVGTGCGVIALCIAKMREDVEKVVAVEVQEGLYRFAVRNVEENDLEEKIEVVHDDVREFAEKAALKFDVIVSNPPFIPSGAGRVSPDEERRIARQEISLDVPSLGRCVRTLLKETGRFFVVYPAWRLAGVMCDLSDEGLCVERIRPVHSFPSEPASLVLLRGKKGIQGEVEILPPLFIYEAQGRYSVEVKKMFGGMIKKGADEV